MRPRPASVRPPALDRSPPPCDAILQIFASSPYPCKVLFGFRINSVKGYHKAMEGSDAVVWTDGYAIVAPHGPTTLPKRLHVPPTRAGLMPQKVLWTRCSRRCQGYH